MLLVLRLIVNQAGITNNSYLFVFSLCLQGIDLVLKGMIPSEHEYNI